MIQPINLPPRNQSIQEEPESLQSVGDTPIASPEAAFNAFADKINEEVAKLQTRQFTKKEAWFRLNAICLEFIGKCADNNLRDEALKLVKYLVDTIPAMDEVKDKDLDTPFLTNMDISKYLSNRQDGRVLSPEEVK